MKLHFTCFYADIMNALEQVKEKLGHERFLLP